MTSAFALAFDGDLDAVRTGLEVLPVRPGQTDVGRQLRSVELRNRHKGLDVDAFMQQWLGAAREVAGAAASAYGPDPSAAALARSAFAHLGAGQREAAEHAAVRALALSRESSTFDEPALLASIRVLAALGAVGILVDLRGSLPGTDQFRGTRATLAAYTDDVPGALELLEPLPDDSFAGLAGYLHLREGNVQRAVALLRRAVNIQERDAASHLNLAIALRELGSVTKALRSAAIAMRVSPGRVDALSLYLDLLAVAGSWRALEAELDHLERAEVTATAHIWVARARMAIRRNKLKEARFYLKKAERLAREDGDQSLEVELRANACLLDYMRGVVQGEEALRRVEESLTSAPDSVALAYIAASFCRTTSDAERLRPLADLHARDISPSAIAFKARMAYLGQEWRRWQEIASDWARRYPQDEEAQNVYIATLTHCDSDWRAAGKVAHRLLSRDLRSDSLLNHCAYALAMAGDGAGAKGALRRASVWDYRLEATLGLACIASGDLNEGLGRYKKADNLIVKASGFEEDRALLRLYLHLGLRRFGFNRSEVVAELRQKELLDAALPANWKDIPLFALLRYRAELGGWRWDSICTSGDSSGA